jgi:uncharacterized protein (DUF2164 family)
MARKWAKPPVLELDRSQTEAVVRTLKRLLVDRFDIELGGLEVEELLQAIGSELGPLYYNKAIFDIQAVVRNRFESLESDVWALEKS